MANATCGAKTRSGDPCQSKKMANGRCRMHGGSTPKGSQNAKKHGIYGDLIQPDELDHCDEISSAVGAIDSELLIARLQLRRALKAQALADQLPDGLEVYETVEREGASEVAAHSEVKKKLRDYPQIIDRIMARIESLEKTRSALLTNNGAPSDDMTREDTFIAPDEALPDAPIL